MKYHINVTNAWSMLWCYLYTQFPLQWRHNGRDRILNLRSNIKNIKAPRHWPLCVEFTGDWWVPRTNGQWRRKCFHLMTSSWSSIHAGKWDPKQTILGWQAIVYAWWVYLIINVSAHSRSWHRNKHTELAISEIQNCKLTLVYFFLRK